MRRSNMQQAFIGEDDASETNFAADRDGNEQVVLDVTGGTVSLVVDGSVPDRAIYDRFRHIQGEIHLEGGKILRFQIYGGDRSDDATVSIVDEGEQTMAAPDLNATQAGLSDS